LKSLKIIIIKIPETMKKINFTIALILLSVFTAFAQVPVITALQHKPAVTEVGSYIAFTSSSSPWVTSLNIQPSGGANLVWDFSSMPTTGGLSETYRFCMNNNYECDGAAIANAYYQSSDMCRVDGLINNSIQLEFLGTSTGVSYGASNDDATYYWVYSPARKELIYDSKYGDASVPQSGTMNINGVLNASYTYTYSIDAYGELRLPGGKIYPKVARIKKVFYANYLSTVIANEIEYYWYDGNRNPLLRYLNDMANTKSEVRYRYNINPVAIMVFTDITAQNELGKIQIFPNPVKDGIINIANLPSEKVVIEIYNMIGEKILTSETKGPQYTLNSGIESQGLYILKLSYGGKTRIEKIIIE
jgi:hypothetical protein